MSVTDRRRFLFGLFAATHFVANLAMAKDGESEGGSENSGSGSSNSGSGSSNSGSGSGSSGSGSGNSGSDGGDDRDDSRDTDRNGDRDDNRSGGRDERDDDDDREHDRARNAVRDGQAVSLRKLKDHLASNYPGKILNIRLRQNSGDYYYSVRILSQGNRIRTISLNALTLKPRGI